MVRVIIVQHTDRFRSNSLKNKIQCIPNFASVRDWNLRKVEGLQNALAKETTLAAVPVNASPPAEEATAKIVAIPVRWAAWVVAGSEAAEVVADPEAAEVVADPEAAEVVADPAPERPITSSERRKEDYGRFTRRRILYVKTTLIKAYFLC